MASSASALISQHYSLRDLWGSASIVVKARVIDRSFHREKGRIYTKYRLEALEHFKGHSTTEFMAHWPGGAVDGLRQVVPGIPEMKPSQEYIVFLRCPTLSRCVPLGYGQGIWKRGELKESWRSLAEMSKLGELSLEQLLAPQSVERSKPSEFQHHSPQVEAQP